MSQKNEHPQELVLCPLLSSFDIPWVLLFTPTGRLCITFIQSLVAQGPLSPLARAPLLFLLPCNHLASLLCLGWQQGQWGNLGQVMGRTSGGWVVLAVLSCPPSPEVRGRDGTLRRMWHFLS